MNAHEIWREQTALMWAADSANAELVKLLIQHGADVHTRAAANDWGAQITSEPRAQYRPTGRSDPAPVRRALGLRRMRARDRRGGGERRSADAGRRHGADGRARQLRVRYGQRAARSQRKSSLRGLVGPHGALSRGRPEHLRAAHARVSAFEKGDGLRHREATARRRRRRRRAAQPASAGPRRQQRAVHRRPA